MVREKTEDVEKKLYRKRELFDLFLTLRIVIVTKQTENKYFSQQIKNFWILAE